MQFSPFSRASECIFASRSWSVTGSDATECAASADFLKYRDMTSTTDDVSAMELPSSSSGSRRMDRSVLTQDGGPVLLEPCCSMMLWFKPSKLLRDARSMLPQAERSRLPVVVDNDESVV